MTPEERRQHLDFAADVLVKLYDLAVEAVKDEERDRVRVVLKDDPNETDLMTLTSWGVRVVAYALRAHDSPEDCAEGVAEVCPLLYLAWVIEGCPEGGAA